ncbi:MAG: glycosyltransferase [Chitinophagales bacterium]|nr:glycosyltransferase [Chitinophagales bacterium]
MKWSIIIFCYNEEFNIAKTIQDVINWLSTPNYFGSEIIIINDGSTDKTADVIQSFIGKFSNLSIINLEYNQGIGNALNKGYDLAVNQYVCAVPGDGQFDVNELSNVNEFGFNEFVTFYRLSKDYNLYRSFLTSFNQQFNKRILKLNVPDVNWIKVYRLEQLSKQHRQLNSSLVESEICAKLIKQGYRHFDYPSQYLRREFGQAKGGSWNTLKKAIMEVFHLYLTVSKYKVN